MSISNEELIAEMLASPILNVIQSAPVFSSIFNGNNSSGMNITYHIHQNKQTVERLEAEIKAIKNIIGC